MLLTTLGSHSVNPNPQWKLLNVFQLLHWLKTRTHQSILGFNCCHRFKSILEYRRHLTFTRAITISQCFYMTCNFLSFTCFISYFNLLLVTFLSLMLRPVSLLVCTATVPYILANTAFKCGVSFLTKITRFH